MTQTEDNTAVRSRQPLTVAELRSHLMQIESGWGDNKKKSDYLPMQGRILWFHGEVSRYTIETELVSLDFAASFSKEKWTKENGKAAKIAVSDSGVAVFKATVTIVHEATGEILMKACGHKMETKIDFPDFLEKAETGAIGRALALLGYGTKFAVELREDERIVDSPVISHNRVEPEIDLAEVSLRVGKAFDFKPDDFEARWSAYKQHVLGRAYHDEELTQPAIKKLLDYAIQHEKKTASVAKAS